MKNVLSLAKFSCQEILPKIGVKSMVFTVSDQEFVVKLLSLRLLLFKRNTTCVSCGRKGSYFSLDLPINHRRPHLNLYSEDGVLMTKDHIIPKSLGGPDKLDNLQTMCVECNSKKGANYTTNT